MDFPNAQAVWQWREGVDAYHGSHVGSKSVVGYDVEATDGRVGTIDESSGRYGVYCLVVDADPTDVVLAREQASFQDRRLDR